MVELTNELRQEVANKLHEIAKEHNYDVSENVFKIAAAKIRLFGEEIRRCPCDGMNANRSCVSLQCKSDIEKDGICHCNLFKKKESKNVNK